MLPIQANIIYRVFFIKAADYGTAFVIDVEGDEYLVTAKHLFNQTATNHEIQIFRNNRWSSHKL